MHNDLSELLEARFILRCICSTTLKMFSINTNFLEKTDITTLIL